MKVKKIKATSVVICFLLVISAIGGISLFTNRSVLETAEAIDIGAKPVVGLVPEGSAPDLDQADLRDIAWNPQGTMAVAVGWSTIHGEGVAYRFESRTGTWNKLNHDGTDLNGVTWDQHRNKFIIVGDASSGGSSVFETTGYDNLQVLDEPPNGNFHDVASDQLGTLLIVGDNEQICLWDGFGWHSVQYWGQDLTGVTWSEIQGLYYIVGIDGGTGVFLSYMPNIPFDDEEDYVQISPPEYTELFNPLYDIDSKDDLLILVGNNVIDIYDVFSDEYYHIHEVGGLDETSFLRGVTWSGSDTAYVVGFDDFDGDGLFYQYDLNLHRVSKLPSSSGIQNSQHSIAGSLNTKMFISVGNYASDSAWQISQTSGFKDIIVNTYYPHIESINLYEIGDGTSRLNTQIDVNADGQTDRVYELHVQVTHQVPDILSTVQFSAWYDDGFTGTDSDYPAEDDTTRTTAFRVEWDRFAAAGDEFSWLWPTIDGDQMEIIPGSHLYNQFADGATDGFDGFDIYFQFIPGPQMRFANGDDGVFDPNLNPYDKGDALTTLNTWDIEVEALDSQGGFNYTYDEFGVYRFTSLTVQGLPGTYSASGAPGMNDVPLIPGGNTFVTYSANCAHSLKVYLETDLIGQDTGQVIPTNRLSVQGGETNKVNIGVPGETGAVYLLGDGLNMWNLPRYRYNYTTSETNTMDELLDPLNSIQWWVDIPMAIPEDSYRSNMVYVLEHEG